MNKIALLLIAWDAFDEQTKMDNLNENRGNIKWRQTEKSSEKLKQEQLLSCASKTVNQLYLRQSESTWRKNSPPSKCLWNQPLIHAIQFEWRRKFIFRVAIVCTKQLRNLLKDWRATMTTSQLHEAFCLHGKIWLHADADESVTQKNSAIVIL